MKRRRRTVKLLGIAPEFIESLNMFWDEHGSNRTCYLSTFPDEAEQVARTTFPRRRMVQLLNNLKLNVQEPETEPDGTRIQEFEYI